MLSTIYSFIIFDFYAALFFIIEINFAADENKNMQETIESEIFSSEITIIYNLVSLMIILAIRLPVNFFSILMLICIIIMTFTSFIHMHKDKNILRKLN